MIAMADIPTPRGMRDLLPNEALFKNELLKKIESVFQRYGFVTIDTPILEATSVLTAKNVIGDESKLIFETKSEGFALKYDQTVSLARYVAMHQNLPMPFKRYIIDKAWRRDEPQKLRYREFTQADVDIVGGRAPVADAEAIATAAKALEEIGFEYTIRLNNRTFVDSVLASMNIKDTLFGPIMKAVDKMDKVGRDGVIQMLQALGLDRDTVDRIDKLINSNGSNEEKLAIVEKTIKDNAALQEIRETLSLLGLYRLKGEVVIDFSLMRGLDYYTGIVVEIMAGDKQYKRSMAGGGRYDKLIGLLGGKPMPAVGISLGIDPILDVLGFSSSPKQTFAAVFVANIKDSNYPYALKTASTLRAAGISVDLNSASRNISNQLAYANSLKFKYAVIVGDGEEKISRVKVRNLVDGEEKTMSIDDAIDLVKKGNNKK